MEGCAEGYFDDGSNCVSCYSQCVSCVDAATCTECITGYWGPSCQYSCPITCEKCTKEGQCIFGKLSRLRKNTKERIYRFLAKRDSFFKYEAPSLIFETFQNWGMLLKERIKERICHTV